MGLHNFQFKKHELSFPKTFLHSWHKNCHKAIICNTIASYKTLVFFSIHKWCGISIVLRSFDNINITTLYIAKRSRNLRNIWHINICDCLTANLFFYRFEKDLPNIRHYMTINHKG